MESRTTNGMDHMTNNNTNAAESKLPDDLEQIAALLEADGRAVRSAPDAGFEARLAAATRPVAGLKLTGSPADATLISQTSSRRMGLWPMRIAAAVALCGGLIAVRMATMNSTTPGTTNTTVATATDQPADDSMEVAFALVGWSDESSSLDDLRTRAESLRSNIDAGVDMTDLLSSEEGAT